MVNGTILSRLGGKFVAEHRDPRTPPAAPGTKGRLAERQSRVHPETWCLGGKRIAGQAPGRPKEEFAPLERRNLFGRGRVSTIWRAVVRAGREAPWG